MAYRPGPPSISSEVREGFSSGELKTILHAANESLGTLAQNEREPGYRPLCEPGLPRGRLIRGVRIPDAQAAAAQSGGPTGASYAILQPNLPQNWLSVQHPLKSVGQGIPQVLPQTTSPLVQQERSGAMWVPLSQQVPLGFLS